MKSAASCRLQILQDVVTLSAGHPLWRPAGFDAGPLLQQTVVLGQFGEASSREPKRGKPTIFTSDKPSGSGSSNQPPTQSGTQTQRLDKRPHLPGRTAQPGRSLQPPSCRKQSRRCQTEGDRCVIADAPYVLQVALPELELGAQSLLAPLQGGVVPLLFRHQQVVVDD